LGKRKAQEVNKMEDIDEILAAQDLNKDNLEAALELARLVAEETDLCCEDLGKFTWSCYLKLEEKHGNR
jgi:hypothetical protein